MSTPYNKYYFHVKRNSDHCNGQSHKDHTDNKNLEINLVLIPIQFHSALFILQHKFTATQSMSIKTLDIIIYLVESPK